MGSTPLTRRPALEALEAQYQTLREVHLRALIADDPMRGERVTDSSTQTVIRRYRMLFGRD